MDGGKALLFEKVHKAICDGTVRAGRTLSHKGSLEEILKAIGETENFLATENLVSLVVSADKQRGKPSNSPTPTP